MDDASPLIGRVGRGAWMAKVDLNDANQHLAVHPSDIELLGMSLDGLIYIDLCLPFGLRTAPVIFNMVADALADIAHARDLRFLIHYLDDYLLLGGSESEVRSDLANFLAICDRLGFTVNHGKTEGPSQRLVFLGLLLNSVDMTIKVGQDRLSQILSTLRPYLSRSSCRGQELSSPIYRPLMILRLEGCSFESLFPSPNDCHTTRLVSRWRDRPLRRFSCRRQVVAILR